MKKQILFSCTVIMVGLSQMGRSNLPADPNIGNRSGVLGSGTEGCGTNGCHDIGSFQPSIVIETASGNIVQAGDGYYADSLYRIKLIADASPEGTFPEWGLQLSAKTANNGDAGTFLPTSNITVDVVDGFEVAEQHTPIPSNNGNSKLLQSILWVAPGNVGTNSITFYTTMLASNNNGLAGGDKYGSQQRTLTEKIATNIGSVRQLLNSTIAPNPTTGTSVVTIGNTKTGSQYTVVVYNQTGSKVYSGSATGTTNDTKINVDLAELANGLYFVHVTDDEGKRKVLPLTKQ